MTKFSKFWNTIFGYMYYKSLENGTKGLSFNEPKTIFIYQSFIRNMYPNNFWLYRSILTSILMIICAKKGSPFTIWNRKTFLLPLDLWSRKKPERRVKTKMWFIQNVYVYHCYLKLLPYPRKLTFQKINTPKLTRFFYFFPGN